MSLLSVIIPVYNVATWIRNTINSVVTAIVRFRSDRSFQKFSVKDIEIICVDDGSTDGSGDIVESVAAELKVNGVAIKVLHQPNSGVSAARNSALDIATSEWIMMLDGDDTWSEDLLVRLFGEILAHPDCDAVGFGIVCVDENGVETGELGRTDAIPAVMSGDEVLLDGRGPYSKFIWSSCDKIYRRSVIEKIPLRYKIGMKQSEDSLFSQEFLAYAKKVVLRPDILGYRYLMRCGSAIHTLNYELPKNPFCSFEILYAHWRKLGTLGLRQRLYYTAVGLPTLGKGEAYSPDVRSKAVDVLVASDVFNKLVLPFAFRYGGWKARLFIGVYMMCPCGMRRRLLELLT